MGKSGKKWIVVFNIVMDLVMAVVMSIAGTLLGQREAGEHTQGIIFFPNLVLSVAISFALAFLISMIIPIPKLSVGFAGLLHIKPHTLAEKLIGNIPVSLIFTAIVGGALTLCNLYLEGHIELFADSFLGSFIPMFLIMFAVTFIMTPIAAVVANKACER